MRSIRIISFLGITGYGATRFWFQTDEKPQDTTARLTDVGTLLRLCQKQESMYVDLIVVGTRDVHSMWFTPRESSTPQSAGSIPYVEDLQEAGLLDRLTGLKLTFIQIPKDVVEHQDLGSPPDSADGAPLWIQFTILQELLAGTSVMARAESWKELRDAEVFPIMQTGVDKPSQDFDEILVDVSNGFRSQPIFATVALAYEGLRRTIAQIQPVSANQSENLQSHAPRISVSYSAFDRDRHELSSYPERPDSSRPARPLSAYTPVSDPHRKQPCPVADLTPIIQAQAWLDALSSLRLHGRGDQVKHLCELQNSPTVQAFGRSVSAFADGICTLRVAETIELNSQAVLKSIDDSEKEITQTFPILSSELYNLHTMIEPLVSTSIYCKTGLEAWGEFARLCFRLQRFAEAVAVAREGYVVASLSLLLQWGVNEGIWQDPVSFDSARCDASAALRRDVVIRTRTQQVEYLSSTKLSPDRIGTIRSIIGKKNTVGKLRNDVLHCGLRATTENGNDAPHTDVRERARAAIEEFYEFQSNLPWCDNSV